jgi:hypothetical protein
MVTLTSQPDGKQGYRMFVDGGLAVEVHEGGTYIGVCWTFAIVATVAGLQ